MFENVELSEWITVFSWPSCGRNAVKNVNVVTESNEWSRCFGSGLLYILYIWIYIVEWIAWRWNRQPQHGSICMLGLNHTDNHITNVCFSEIAWSMSYNHITNVCLLESGLTNPYPYMLADNCLKSEICIHAVWWYTYILCGMCLHAVEQCMCLSMLKYLYVSVRKCAELCFKRKHQAGNTGSVPYRGPEKGTQAVKKKKTHLC